jgi:hypothetical protein
MQIANTLKKLTYVVLAVSLLGGFMIGAAQAGLARASSRTVSVMRISDARTIMALSLR